MRSSIASECCQQPHEFFRQILTSVGCKLFKDSGTVGGFAVEVLGLERSTKALNCIVNRMILDRLEFILGELSHNRKRQGFGMVDGRSRYGESERLRSAAARSVPVCCPLGGKRVSHLTHMLLPAPTVLRLALS